MNCTLGIVVGALNVAVIVQLDPMYATPESVSPCTTTGTAVALRSDAPFTDVKQNDVDIEAVGVHTNVNTVPADPVRFPSDPLDVDVYPTTGRLVASTNVAVIVDGDPTVALPVIVTPCCGWALIVFEVARFVDDTTPGTLLNSNVNGVVSVGDQVSVYELPDT